MRIDTSACLDASALRHIGMYQSTDQRLRQHVFMMFLVVNSTEDGAQVEKIVSKVHIHTLLSLLATNERWVFSSLQGGYHGQPRHGTRGMKLMVRGRPEVARLSRNPAKVD